MFRSKIKRIETYATATRRRYFQPAVLALEDRLAPATLLHSLFLSEPQQGANFGGAVATDTNFHVVGASSSAVGGFTNVGQAFVYNASTGALIATLNNPTPAYDDGFGGSVAVSGNTVVVGASFDTAGAMAAGSAYLFNATTGALLATMNNPTPATYDYFGCSVALSGNTAVVGAIWDDTLNTDQGAAYVYSLAPAQVSAIQVYNGAVQRSRVTTIDIPFDQIVTFSGPAANAFQLQRQSDGALVNLAASVNNTGPGTVVTLTFTGTTAVDFGSLADGRYTLTIFHDAINSGNFDGDPIMPGNNDYMLVSTGSPPTNIFRLFGDSNGDGTVNGTDFLAFRLAFLGTNATFDFDGDGQVTGTDFLQFRLRFLVTV